MTGEIPQNEVRSVTHIVSESGLFLLFEELHVDPNVLKIEHKHVGSEFEVTIHFAIMDLALQLAAVSASIEKAVAEADDTAYVTYTHS